MRTMRTEAAAGGWVLENFEEDHVGAVRASTNPRAEVRTSRERERRSADGVTSLADLADERQRPRGIVDGDEIRDLLEVALGLR
jgi:hypothetical protein